MAQTSLPSLPALSLLSRQELGVGQCCVDPCQLMAQILQGQAAASCSHAAGKWSHPQGWHHKAPHLGPFQERLSSGSLQVSSTMVLPSSGLCLLLLLAPSPATGVDYGCGGPLPTTSPALSSIYPPTQDIPCHNACGAQSSNPYFSSLGVKEGFLREGVSPLGS